MIKFFRRIRQRLMAENKFGKYLLYALGEIILVVIGILIALSINTMNEKRKEDQQEQVILKRLQKEFTANKKQLLNKMEVRESIILSCQELLFYFDEPETGSYEEIIRRLGSLIPTTYDPVENDLVNSGNVEIIKNEELKQMLVNWSTDVIQLREVEQMYLKFLEEIVEIYLIEQGLARDAGHSFWQLATTSLLEYQKIENPIPKKARPNKISTSQLLSDPKLEGIITRSLNLNVWNNQESQTLMKRINGILALLKEEIKVE
jgi:hypothetical protein